MAATIIDGRAVAQRVREQTAREVEELAQRTGRPPGLATILVGDDPASAVYVANKREACAEAGIADHHQHLSADVTQHEVAELIERCNRDPEISGILLQLPVPAGLNGQELTGSIAPGKDVDGLTPISVGRLVRNTPGLRPCTPVGVIELLDAYEVPLEGAQAVVVGRSDLVGKPVSFLLLQRNATVTICHSRTQDLPAVCSRADVLVAAAGIPRLLGAEHVTTVKRHTERGGVGDGQVHDHRFDEHLTPSVVELVDDQAHGRVIAVRRGDDQRIGALVGRDAQLAFEGAGGSASGRAGWRGRRAASAASGRACAAEHLIERLRHLLGDRVLQWQDVDLAGLGRLRIEPLEHLEQAQIGILGADDNQ